MQRPKFKSLSFDPPLPNLMHKKERSFFGSQEDLDRVLRASYGLRLKVEI